ncbi:MAG TPA: phosphoribosylamine--glycine ligase [Gemmatimonadales bacterium]|nr:phosphoribosylamine--glycine ligase [Gemmatimonadales bacterium]
MRILVVGAGGREHALLWAIRRDAPQATLFCLPGNAGTAHLATNLPGTSSDVEKIAQAALDQRVDLVVVGPESPLAAGLVDRLAKAGIPAFGPTAAAARIESSKAFSKGLMLEHGIPTATARTFTDYDSAARYIGQHAEPLVVKASGLAAGKGAIVCRSRSEAQAAAGAMLRDRAFGAAGAEILVEEYLDGEELSVLALTDGEHFAVLPPAQDHKRLKDGDQGPNTGGMGAYSPVSIASEALLAKVADQVFEPTLAALRNMGAPYRGMLYAGLMIMKDGSIRVIEFNCRFGDPEAQAILPVLPGGVLPVLRLVAEGGWMPPGHTLGDARCAAVTTVLAAAGYPDSPQSGAPITVPAHLEADPDVHVFHAGTSTGSDGSLQVAGGRVLAVTATGPTVADAAEKSRAAAEAIGFEGKQFRRDIGWREISRRR